MVAARLEGLFPLPGDSGGFDSHGMPRRRETPVDAADGLAAHPGGISEGKCGFGLDATGRPGKMVSISRGAPRQ